MRELALELGTACGKDLHAPLPGRGAGGGQELALPIPAGPSIRTISPLPSATVSTAAHRCASSTSRSSKTPLGPTIIGGFVKRA